MLLTITLFVGTVISQTHPIPTCPDPPNCAHYPPMYFVNDPSDCQAYFFCESADSLPIRGKCPLPLNFDQGNQLCNNPDDYPCYLC